MSAIGKNSEDPRTKSRRKYSLIIIPILLSSLVVKIICMDLIQRDKIYCHVYLHVGKWGVHGLGDFL